MAPPDPQGPTPPADKPAEKPPEPAKPVVPRPPNLSTGPVRTAPGAPVAPPPAPKPAAAAPAPKPAAAAPAPKPAAAAPKPAAPVVAKPAAPSAAKPPPPKKPAPPPKKPAPPPKKAAPPPPAPKKAERRAAPRPAPKRPQPAVKTARPVSKPAPAADKHGVRTLCIDIGGTGLKALIVNEHGKPLCERARVETPRPATPKAITEALFKLIRPLGAFDRISCGFPGVVFDNTPHTAPNLDKSWSGFPLGQKLAAATGHPARVLNDAGVQGFGVIEGKGLEMVLTLGTGLGCALFIDGRYVPNLELAHHPFRHGKTYEEYVGAKAYEKVGKKKWNKRVRRVLEQVLPIWNPRQIYLGGGNAKHLKGALPKNVKITENVAGLLGGIALWKT